MKTVLACVFGWVLASLQLCFAQEKRQEIATIIRASRSALESLQSFDVFYTIETFDDFDEFGYSSKKSQFRVVVDQSNCKAMIARRVAVDELRPDEEDSKKPTTEGVLQRKQYDLLGVSIVEGDRVFSRQLPAGIVTTTKKSFENACDFAEIPFFGAIGVKPFPPIARAQSQAKETLNAREAFFREFELAMSGGKVLYLPGLIQIESTLPNQILILGNNESVSVPGNSIKLEIDDARLCPSSATTYRNGVKNGAPIRVFSWRETYEWSTDGEHMLIKAISGESEAAHYYNKKATLYKRPKIVRFRWLKYNQPLDDSLFDRQLLSEVGRMSDMLKVSFEE